MRSRSLSAISPYRFAQRVGISRSKTSPATMLLGLELLWNACPLGALLLDSDYCTAFANREGLELLSRWNDPTGRAARVRESRVPEEIVSACDTLRRGKSTGRAKGRPLFGERLYVSHPKRNELAAVVALERSPRDRRLALFCVFLHDRLRENLVSGRRDHLAMLSVAERRVAKLVSEGLRNQEIATCLGKAVTTVKSQLGAIFSKLGITSRTQLATLLRAQ
jgi:DNA-binding CsgD family transcriptional regulator